MNMPVQALPRHRHITGGDHVEQPEKYDATYRIGRTTVHVVAPPPMTQEEIDKVLDEVYAAAWVIIDDLVERGIEV